MGRDVVPSTPGAAYADPSDAGGFAKAPVVPKVKDWERRDPCFWCVDVASEMDFMGISW